MRELFQGKCPDWRFGSGWQAIRGAVCQWCPPGGGDRDRAVGWRLGPKSSGPTTHGNIHEGTRGALGLMLTPLPGGQELSLGPSHRGRGGSDRLTSLPSSIPPRSGGAVRTLGKMSLLPGQRAYLKRRKGRGREKDQNPLPVFASMPISPSNVTSSQLPHPRPQPLRTSMSTAWARPTICKCKKIIKTWGGGPEDEVTAWEACGPY